MWLFLVINAIFVWCECKITPEQYVQLTSDIESLIAEKNCAPILVRLAWHDAGTYDSNTNTGGPHASMRFENGVGEATHDANNGLEIARNLLLPLTQKYTPDPISVADLWALSGTIAIKSANGPDIPFKFGRSDASTATDGVEEGRLPDAKQGVGHVRSVLGRIGFSDDKYVVALSGAHTLGECHVDRSGFGGAWTENPFVFDNSYFKDLLDKKWIIDVSAAGNTQFNTVDGRTMMLPSDWTLVNHDETRKYVELYANDQHEFFQDFSYVWTKLIQSGYNDEQLYAVDINMKSDL